MTIPCSRVRRWRSAGRSSAARTTTSTQETWRRSSASRWIRAGSPALARSLRPGLDAAAAFARFLRKDGITVGNTPVQSRPGTGGQQGQVIAAVKSPALTQIVQWMLQESNNVIAETL